MQESSSVWKIQCCRSADERESRAHTRTHNIRRTCHSIWHSAEKYLVKRSWWVLVDYWEKFFLSYEVGVGRSHKVGTREIHSWKIWLRRLSLMFGAKKLICLIPSYLITGDDTFRSSKEILPRPDGSRLLNNLSKCSELRSTSKSKS